MKELIFGLIGGTALLMYGVDLMGEGLEKVSGPMMKKILATLTNKVWKAFLAGTILTALVQSSTAITVLTVGFVNAGLMSLKQAVGIIYGANIGTTITAQLMAFSFKLTDIALLVLGIGFAIKFFSKKRYWQDLGLAIMGFGIMFLGLKILNSNIPIVKNSETTRYFFEHYANRPFLAVLIGMVATMLVHSSSATVGLTMVLAQAGLINLNGAIGLMLGDNIGTCITAQMASLGTSVAARRTAWAHTLYNIIGVILAMMFFSLFKDMIQGTSTYISQQIANSHTIFNVLSAVIFLPLTNLYVSFLERIVPEAKDFTKGGQTRYLDPLLLDTPVAAINAVNREIQYAASLTRQMVNKAMAGFFANEQDLLEKVLQIEETVNDLQKQITQYLISLSHRQVGADLSSKIPALLHAINDIERIGDHAENLVELAQIKIEKRLVFSEQALQELQQLLSLIDQMMELIDQALGTNNVLLAKKVSQIEEKVDNLTDALREKHIYRLEAGTCYVESGVIFLDMISNFERIADHLYNIAVAITKDWRWENINSQNNTDEGPRGPQITINYSGR